MAYLGTDKTGGIIMEIVQRPDDFDPEKAIQFRETWD
jgi:hypothetical protein